MAATAQVTPHDWLLRPDWPVPPNVHAGTTLRTGPGISPAPFDRFNLGANCCDDPAAVATNRAALVAHASLPSSPRWLQQIHGTTILRNGVRDNFDNRAGDTFQNGAGDNFQAPVADAAVTSTPGIVLAVLTADCLPVVFAARDGSEVAVAHAGWRGLASGILEQTVRAMHASPGEVIAWLGPAAGPGAYEVGRDVFEAFAGEDAAHGTFVATRPDHWLVDLYALARARLAQAGIASVHGGGLCTISDATRFYSYRRDRETGRMATLAWLDAP